MLKGILGILGGLLLALAVWVPLATPSLPDPVAEGTTKVSFADAQIVNELLQNNIKWAWIGFLALERGECRGITELGLMLIDHSERVNKELAMLANRLRVDLAPEEVIPQILKRMEELRRVPRGREFDQALLREALVLMEPPPSPSAARNGEIRVLLVKMHRMMEGDYLRVVKVGRDLGIPKEELRRHIR